MSVSSVASTGARSTITLPIPVPTSATQRMEQRQSTTITAPAMIQRFLLDFFGVGGTTFGSITGLSTFGSDVYCCDSSFIFDVSFTESLIVVENKPANGLRYPLVGGTRKRHFDGTNFKPRKVLENAQTPTRRVHAVLAAIPGALISMLNKRGYDKTN